MIEKAKMALDFLSAQPDVQELARQRELAQINWLTSARASEAKAPAAALLALLRARGLAVPPVLRERILACDDLAFLDRVVDR